MRKSISKTTRFNVFKRDSFTCQYCNSKPPNTTLEIDHIKPVSKGGDNAMDNLITACYDCNRGKSKNELTDLPDSLVKKTELIKMATYQYKQYQKVLKLKRDIIDMEINQVEKCFNGFYKNESFTEKFKVTIKNFNSKLGVDEVISSMKSACFRFEDYGKRNSYDVLKYFCGICWNKIKNNEY